jgi:ice-binding like protein
MSRKTTPFLLIALVATLCSTFSARANVLQALPSVGDLERWGAFTLGSGGITEQDDMVGTTDIYGDVGVAGNGNLTMTGNSTIHGDLYWMTPGTLTMKGASKVTGAKHHDAASDAILANGVNEANSTSASAQAFLSSAAYASLTSITSSMTLVAQHDRPGNSTVLNLTNVNLGDHSILTLSGTATDVFIINVSQMFSLGAQSKIVLTGGLAWDDVLFNVTGNGSPVSLGAQSELNGILLANRRNVTMNGGSLVRGEVIANSLTMKGGSQIIHPPVTSP